MNALGISLVWCALQVTLLAAVTAAVYSLARRREPAVRSHVALAGLLAALGLSLLAFSPWPRWTLADAGPQTSPLAGNGFDGKGLPSRAAGGREMPSTAEESTAVLGDGVASRDLADSATTFWRALLDELRGHKPAAQAAGQPAWRWPATLALLLGLGVGAGALRLGAAWFAVRRLCRQSRTIEDARAKDILTGLCARLVSPRLPELRESNGLATPATIGWRRPVILLPDAWPAWSDQQLRAVLAHEIAHIRGGDFAAWFAAQLGVLTNFYHPLVHWLAGRLRLDQELAADAAAAQVAGGPRAYLHVLAGMALEQSNRPVAWPARPFLPTRRTFLRRIEMLRDPRPTNLRGKKWAGGLCIAGVLIAGVAAAGLRQAEFGTSEPSPDGAQDARTGPVSTLDDAGDILALTLQQDAGPATRNALSHVPAETQALIVVRPAGLLSRPEMKPLSDFLLGTRDARTPLDIAWNQLDQLAWIVLPPVEPRPQHPTVLMLPMGALSVRTTQPHDFADVLKEHAPNAVRVPIHGREYFKSEHGDGLAYFRPDDRSLILGSERDVARIVAAGEAAESKLVSGASSRLLDDSDYFVSVDAGLIRVQLERAEAELARQSAQAAQYGRGGPSPQAQLSQLKLAISAFTPLWEKTDVITFAGRAGRSLSLNWLFACQDAEGAASVEATVNALLTLYRNVSGELAASAQQGPGTPQQAFLTTLASLAQELLNATRIERVGALVQLTTSADLEVAHANAAKALAEAVKGARTAARRTMSANNLKQIALAMHNYHDVYGRFPPAVLIGPDGKTEYSWRVAILPFVDAAPLYEQYRRDEPWDSPNNRKVLAQMPPVFRNPADDTDSTNAACFALVHPSTVFTGMAGRADRAGTAIREIVDGTSNTIMVAEARRDIPWTKPEDIPFDPDKDPPNLGGYWDGGFYAAMSDGRVLFMRENIDAGMLKLLIMKADGQPVPTSALQQ